MADSGGGGGYELPISLSAAESTSIPQTVSAGVNFFFASPNSRGDVFDFEQESILPATATSTSAQGDATSETGVSALGGNRVTDSGDLQKTLLIAGAVALIAIAGLAVYLKR